MDQPKLVIKERGLNGGDAFVKLRYLSVEGFHLIETTSQLVVSQVIGRDDDFLHVTASGAKFVSASD